MVGSEEGKKISRLSQNFRKWLNFLNISTSTDLISSGLKYCIVFLPSRTTSLCKTEPIPIPTFWLIGTFHEWHSYLIKRSILTFSKWFHLEIERKPWWFPPICPSPEHRIGNDRPFAGGVRPNDWWLSPRAVADQSTEGNSPSVWRPPRWTFAYLCRPAPVFRWVAQLKVLKF